MRCVAPVVQDLVAEMNECVGADLPFVVVYCAVLVARRTLSGSCFTSSCSGMLFSNIKIRRFSLHSFLTKWNKMNKFEVSMPQ